MHNLDPETITRQFLRAFSDADFLAMRALLADDARAFVTNAQGGVDRVDGADDYLARVAAMDLPTADLSISITQLARIAPEQIMAMVEVQARRGERTLHNYAAHLLTIHAGRISLLWMVEAKPLDSAEFWSA